MKKIIALVCAGVLAASFSVSALAAHSPSPTTTTTTTTAVSSAVKGNSTVAAVKVYDKVKVNGKESDAVVSITEASSAIKAEAVAQAGAGTVVETFDVNFSGSFSSITIAFNVKNVMAGDTIVVLHKKADGTWEKITPDAVVDGKVTATFTSLSPVAIVKVAAGAAGVTSPKTGDASMMVLAMGAMASLVGAAAAARKSR